MVDKFDRVRDAFARGHRDLFNDEYQVEFFSYTAGTYDSGEQTGRSRNSVGTATCEIVPPQADSTITRSGSGLSFVISIRLLDGDSVISDLDFPGDGVEKPSEAEIPDTVANADEVYQVSEYEEERGSGFVLVRLEEL